MAKSKNSNGDARSASLEKTLDTLTKRFGEGAIMRLGDAQHMVVETIPTGSLSLDIALGVGGLPRGRVIEIYGPESSGKTTVCQHIIAEAQKRGGVCAFVDMEHALDPNYAERCGVDITNLYVSQPDTGELLRYHDIPAGIMPEVLDSAAMFGRAAPEWFGAEIPITGVAGDQQAALVGQACFSPGMTKSTYGTGCFLMANTGSQPVHSTQQLLTTVAYRLNGQTTYALEGSIFAAGVTIKWLRDQLGLISDPADTEAAFAATGGDTGGVYVVPAFTGLGAPYWRPEVRGLVTGLSLETNRDQLVTACLQSVGFQTEELLRAMAADGAEVARLRVDGGMVVNDRLCQFLADVIGVPVERPRDIETTALGAAVLAGMGLELFDDLESASRAWRLQRSFESTIAATERERLLAGYAQAVRQATMVS